MSTKYVYVPITITVPNLSKAVAENIGVAIRESPRGLRTQKTNAVHSPLQCLELK